MQVRRRASPKCEWGSTIWQQWLPPRFSLLTWRIIHGGLPTDDKIRKVGVHLPSRCVCCSKSVETMLHLFFEGIWATSVWGFLECIFERRKPQNVESLTKDWFSNFQKKKARSNLRLGLTCVGLHYIWKLRNANNHGDRQVFNSHELTKWAGYLVNFIPRGDADREDFRRIQILLHIPFNIRSTIEGRWAIWEPDYHGCTMDVAISEERTSTAILIRDNKGKFLRANKSPIKDIRCVEDLRNIIETWRDRAGFNITTICYAHHFHCTDGWGDGVKVKKVHHLLLRAAMSLCFNDHMIRPVDDMDQLPRATQRLIFQDIAKLRTYCPTENDARDQNCPQPTQCKDDNNGKRFSLTQHDFIDDTNIPN